MAQAIAARHPYRAVIAALVQLGQRKKGWDSYDGAPVDHSGLLAAIDLVNRLDDVGRVLEPEVGSLPDGGVLLRWLTPDREVEVIYRDKGGEYVVRRRDTDVIVEERSLASIDILKEVVQDHVLGRRKLENVKPVP